MNFHFLSWALLFPSSSDCKGFSQYSSHSFWVVLTLTFVGEKTPLRAGEEDELDWFWHRRHKSFFAPMWFLPLNFEWEGLRYFPPLILVKTSAHKTQIQIFVHMQIFALHTKNTKSTYLIFKGLEFVKIQHVKKCYQMKNF